jgi:RimJ/RimL family protein N-acetyltransferase
MIPELETERLRLRGWSEADFDAFAAIYADETQARWIGGACGREDARRRFAGTLGHWTAHGYGLWALEAKGDGRFVGWAGLWKHKAWPEPEIGWALVREAQGRGLATEAASRAREHAYEVLGWTTAISMICTPNQASIAVAGRLGARREHVTMFREIETGIFRYPDRNGNITLKTYSN